MVFILLGVIAIVAAVTLTALEVVYESGYISTRFFMCGCCVTGAVMSGLVGMLL